MPESAVRPIVFDFGNVIAFFDYRRACETFGRRLGLEGEAFLDRVVGLGFRPLLRSYESGRIDTDTFRRDFCALMALEVSAEEFEDAWTDIFWLNDDLARHLPFLKRAGHRLVLGSNTNPLHTARFRNQFEDALSYFDALVLSHEVGHCKPDRDFYLACARAAGAEPSECVFIDDLEENVEGARSAGLRGILFKDVPTLDRDLRAHGVTLTQISNS